ncbi:hypothetical protein [Petrotoga olearia]|uniref:Uncharacterized protein n=2 Tax=Petrotoga olearia TaxID=156203 RepID=A0A2K1NXA3_9BACT|nr:hypothetical protein [Petrotoga olearia]PNR95172.1 hypothetical protein X929_09415 [Petrotoga olearia DSM 13574]RMA72903.1 hypothetical protein C8D75_1188 [Petrotoga olearia]
MIKVMTFLLLISLSWFLIVFSVYLKISSYGYTLEGSLKDFYVENASLMKVKPFIEEGKIEEAELNGYKIYKKDGKIIIKRMIE